MTELEQVTDPRVLAELALNGHNVVPGGTSQITRREADWQGFRRVVVQSQHPSWALDFGISKHEAAVRAAMIHWCNYLTAHGSAVHYPLEDHRTMQVAPIATLAELTKVMSTGKLSIDCSQYDELIAHLAGARNPNTGNYHWIDGYTGTMLAACDHITMKQALPGDFRIYGGGTGHHTAVVVSVTPLRGVLDPLLSSQGREEGPLPVRDSVEARVQPPGGAWLRLPL